jgi:hypothetical protein
MLSHFPVFSVDSSIGVDGARAIGVMLQRNCTLLELAISRKHHPFVGASSSLELESVPTATRNARDFADCFETSAEGSCLVLDALERNSSLTKLDLQGEIGTQATFVQLRGGYRACESGGGAEANALLVTPACAGNKLGAEGGRRAKSLLERNTTLTSLTLPSERVACVVGGRVLTARARFSFCLAKLAVSLHPLIFL